MGFALPAIYVPWILGGCLLAVVVAIRAYTQSRRAPYFLLREQARARCSRAVMAILLLLALMAGVAVAPR
jgi:hypothetical protein